MSAPFGFAFALFVIGSLLIIFGWAYGTDPGSFARTLDPVGDQLRLFFAAPPGHGPLWRAPAAVTILAMGVALATLQRPGGPALSAWSWVGGALVGAVTSVLTWQLVEGILWHPETSLFRLWEVALVTLSIFGGGMLLRGLQGSPLSPEGSRYWRWTVLGMATITAIVLPLAANPALFWPLAFVMPALSLAFRDVSIECCGAWRHSALVEGLAGFILLLCGLWGLLVLPGWAAIGWAVVCLVLVMVCAAAMDILMSCASAAVCRNTSLYWERYESGKGPSAGLRAIDGPHSAGLLTAPVSPGPIPMGDETSAKGPIPMGDASDHSDPVSPSERPATSLPLSGLKKDL